MVDKAKPDFARAWSTLVGNEGGYSNNPADPGGETMWGVTARVARANGYTGPMKDLPLERARAIAKAEYWDKYRCGDMPSHEVAFEVLDAAYNGGHPAEWLQEAAKVTVDGHIGPVTLAAVAAADQDDIVMRFDASRLEYLAKQGPSAFAAFGRGWMNRIAANLRRAAEE